MDKFTWILASQSPRRAQLLADAGVKFEAIKPPFDDPPQPQDTGDSPEHIAMQLSLQKALSIQKIRPETRIISADTLIVMPDGSLAGTPTSRPQAKQQITDMLNCAHWVVTGVTLLIPEQKTPIQLADRAQVTLGNIAESEINLYLDTNQWQGKAGGYNLFDRQKAGWPVTVEGDETTVVGLPMGLLKDYLQDNS
jgi:septum formation protein